MADELNLGDGDSAPPPPKGNRNLVIMGIMTAAWVGGAAGMYFATMKAKGGGGGHGASAEEAPAHGGEKEEAAAEGEGGHSGEQSVITMPSFIANLTPEIEGDLHYLKCTLAMSLATPGAEKLLEQRGPKLRNQIIMYLSGLKMSDVEGTENKRKLVAHLLELTNGVVGQHKVEEVYLTEFVIQ